MRRRLALEPDSAAWQRPTGGVLEPQRVAGHLRVRTPGIELWWFASVLLVAAGAAASAYLLHRTFALLATPHPAAADLCSVLFATTCDTTLASARSWILGVPVAGWGLVYFSALGCLLFLARFLRQTFAAEALLAAWLLTVAGVVAGVVLSIEVWSGRAAFCPLCYVVHVIDVLLLLAVHLASGGSPRKQARLLVAAGGWLLGSRPEGTLARWKLLGLGSVALAAAFTYQWVYVESALRRSHPVRPTAAQIVAAHRDAPRVELPVRGDEPHLGPLGAPAQLVVFASFECPACRAFAPAVSRLHEEFGDRLLIAFKHYPLSSDCNERLTTDKQPGSCEIAWAAEAAHRQGRFWSFHDAVFAAPDGGTASTIGQAVRQSGLDVQRFEADRRSTTTREQVADDIALGTRIQVPGTPAVYLDGRLVRPADLRTLEVLIRRQLVERAGPGEVRPDPALGAAASGAGSAGPALANAVVPDNHPSP